MLKQDIANLVSEVLLLGAQVHDLTAESTAYIMGVLDGRKEILNLIPAGMGLVISNHLGIKL